MLLPYLVYETSIGLAPLSKLVVIRVSKITVTIDVLQSDIIYSSNVTNMSTEYILFDVICYAEAINYM